MKRFQNRNENPDNVQHKSSTRQGSAIMKVPISVLLFFSIIYPTRTYNPEVYDYVLSSIEYLADVHTGVFSCVFFDAAPDLPSKSSLLEAILKSPRLDRHVTKYILNGTYHERLEKLPSNPSLLLISFGDVLDRITFAIKSLSLFDPATKILIFVNQKEEFVLNHVLLGISILQFTYSVFLDSSTMVAMYCNGINCEQWPQLPKPNLIFEKDRRNMTGRKVIYVGNENYNMYGFDWNHHWLNETVRYLHTEAVALQHNCVGYGDLFYQCLFKLSVNNVWPFDIILNPAWVQSWYFKQTKNFNILFTNIPVFMKIAVPRDRPLNVAEMILLPFSWEVWILLVIIIFLAEVIKHLYPQYFRNDPFLLAVCGFERHNLHQAGRWEKIIFLALIIIMFFMTNAFETKIVSLMTSKPSKQGIKTLSDLLNSNIQFREDIENNPHFAECMIAGKMIVQGKALGITETVPGVGLMTYSDLVELTYEVAFDWDRMQPFYVVLDYTSFEGPETYATGWRSLFLQPFRLIHGRLFEAGLLNHWKRQWKNKIRSGIYKRNSNMNTQSTNYLVFEDMQPAWMILVAGLIIGLFGFIGEHFKKWFNSWWSLERFQNQMLKFRQKLICKCKRN